MASAYQSYFFQNKYNSDTIDANEEMEFEDPPYDEYIELPNADSTELFNIIQSRITNLKIPPNDVTVLSHAYEQLREIDFLVRQTGRKTMTTFESQEVHENLEQQCEQGKLSKEQVEEKTVALRRSKKFNFWANRGVMKLSTIHSFKGWEVHTLFLIILNDPPANEKEHEFPSEELIYTAITRCRHNLIVINLGNELYQQFFAKHMTLLQS